jgi:hypothetical protein
MKVGDDMGKEYVLLDDELTDAAFFLMLTVAAALAVLALLAEGLP